MRQGLARGKGLNTEYNGFKKKATEDNLRPASGSSHERHISRVDIKQKT